MAGAVKPVINLKETTDSDVDFQAIVKQVLASTNLRLTGFSANELQNHAGRNQPVLLLTSVESTKDAAFVVCTSAGKELTLDHFLNAVAADRSTAACIVLQTNSDNANDLAQLHSQVSSFVSETAAPVSVVISPPNTEDFFVALLCEMVNFIGLETASAAPMTQNDFKDVFTTLSSRYLEMEHSSVDLVHYATIPQGADQSSVMWSGGERFATAVDIETIRKGSRQEQVSDTALRTLNAAGTLRFQHQPKSERLVCSQGLMWLAQTDPTGDYPDWIRDTQLFAEVHHELAAMAAPEPWTVRTASADEMRRVLADIDRSILPIPKGAYRLGTDSDEIGSEPPNNVSGICMEEVGLAKVPVTRRQWATLFALDQPSTNPRHPVTNVSFLDAQEFVTLLNGIAAELTSMETPRLPFFVPDANIWEVAASGPSQRKYPWGDAGADNKANYGMKFGNTTPVGSFPNGAGPFGHLDLAGNVREWTQTTSFKRVLPTVSPSTRMIVKGGSYSYDDDCLQGWVNNQLPALRRDQQTGFRVARY